MKIAVLLSCYNRKDKTLECLKSLYKTYCDANSDIEVEVFLTDDGCSDGTSSAVLSLYPFFSLHILKGDGKLYWNGGMNLSWKEAIKRGDFDGYLWLNDDCIVFPEFWGDIVRADGESLRLYGKTGIYVGSTCDNNRTRLTYGGFKYINKWLLIDQFVYPDESTFQACSCAHGNITYISHTVVEQMGVLCEEYRHGGGDHDYTYSAYKAGFPILVLPHYAGICENDHKDKIGSDAFSGKNLKERLQYLSSPHGMNLHNTLLFQKRCFPYRYLPVLVVSYLKAIFPNISSKIYLLMRRCL